MSKNRFHITWLDEEQCACEAGADKSARYLP